MIFSHEILIRQSCMVRAYQRALETGHIQQHQQQMQHKRVLVTAATAAAISAPQNRIVIARIKTYGYSTTQ